ncbi:hypothetical protein E3N88_18387 [Mikania micrantha]|uniref:Uncharacterized protein n=1 Tax=Mikania micrantha TaxID=192012 RepID=A0A5N6NK81_9ASTR|nr:hypothetical protein E3N88_18387 [Mikania micrantha]
MDPSRYAKAPWRRAWRYPKPLLTPFEVISCNFGVLWTIGAPIGSLGSHQHARGPPSATPRACYTCYNLNPSI